MAKKQQSFAEKASKQSKKELTYVKYVKSIPSEKKGFWRFNETTIALNKGENLDAALKRIDDDENLAENYVTGNVTNNVTNITEDENKTDSSRDSFIQNIHEGSKILYEHCNEKFTDQEILEMCPKYCHHF